MLVWLDRLMRKILRKSKSKRRGIKFLKWLWGVKDKDKVSKIEKGNLTPKVKQKRIQATTMELLLKKWNTIGEKEKDLTVDELFKQVNTDGELKSEFNSMRNKVYKILVKENLGRTALSPNEQLTLKLFKQTFLKNQDNKITDWTKIHSSWLTEGKYSYKQKTFKVKMLKAGGKVYTFYGVPENKFLLICLAPANAGKRWWNRYVNMWQYSRGKYGALGTKTAMRVAELKNKRSKK